MAQPAQYEYRVESFKIEELYPIAVGRMNELGLDGWTVVAVNFPSINFSDVGRIVVTFEREL